MNLVITIIGVLMVADSAFTLLNINKVESILHKAFPNLNVKKVAIVEGTAGVLIVGAKIMTNSVL